MSNSTPILISIEGNIGSGKSTLLKKLRELEPSWTFVDEPVDSWLNIRDEHGKSLLQAFYDDIPRWAYTFQNAAVLSRGEMIKDAIAEWQRQYEEFFARIAHGGGEKKSRIILMERCVETDKNLFADMLHKDGKLNGIEWTLYNKWYTFISTMIPKMNCFIWIDTDPHVCSERIKKRGREGEDEIPLSYLKQLDEAHTKWLAHAPTTVLRSQSIEEIRKFIHTLDE